MGLSKFGLSDEQFWSMSPRTMFDLVNNWKNIETGLMQLASHIDKGGEVEMYKENPPRKDEPQMVDSRFM